MAASCRQPLMDSARQGIERFDPIRVQPKSAAPVPASVNPRPEVHTPFRFSRSPQTFGGIVMNSLFRCFVFALLGLALAGFGIYHAVTSYPASSAFAAVSRDLPQISAVASFWFGIMLALLGLGLWAPVLLRLSRPQPRRIPLHTGTGAPGPAHDRHDEDWDLDPTDPYGLNPGADGYGPHRPHHGGDVYAGAYGMTAGRNGWAPAPPRR